MDFKGIEKNDVENFLNELICCSRKPGVKSNWECLNTHVEYYDKSRFSQIDACVKYIFTDKLCDIDKLFFTRFFADGNERFNLEVILAEDSKHICELPYLDELQDALSKLNSAILEHQPTTDYTELRRCLNRAFK